MSYRHQERSYRSKDDAIRMAYRARKAGGQSVKIEKRGDWYIVGYEMPVKYA